MFNNCVASTGLIPSSLWMSISSKKEQVSFNLLHFYIETSSSNSILNSNLDHTVRGFIYRIDVIYYV